MGNSINKHLTSIVVKENTDDSMILERYQTSKNNNNSPASIEVLFFSDRDIKNLQSIADKIYREKKQKTKEIFF